MSDVAARLDGAPALEAIVGHAPPPLLVFFPDYRPTNPYQTALYAGWPDPARVRAGTLEDAARLAAQGEDVAFHLHWPELLFADCGTADRFAHRAHAVLAWLRHLRRHGGRCIWTAHNAHPHDDDAPERLVRFQRELADVVDAVHVHSAEAAAILEARIGIPRARCIVIPHGTLPRPLPDDADRRRARERLGLAETATLFAFVGQLRTYKGIDRLVAAYQLVRRARPDIGLLIAGKPVPATLAGRWAGVERTVPGAVVREGFLGDDELDACLVAADAVVLPYSTILTSGAAHLAASRGVPLILPDLPTLAEFARDGAALDFAAGNVEALAAAMHRFADLAPDARAAMAGKALDFAKARAWPIVGARFARCVTRLPTPADAVAMPSAANDAPLSLAVLYDAAHALGRAHEPHVAGTEPWRALLAPSIMTAAPGLRTMAERALRAGWCDGAGGQPADAGGDIAARIDTAGVLPGEDDVRGHLEMLDCDHIGGWAVMAMSGALGGQSWRSAGTVWLLEENVPIAAFDASGDRADVLAAGFALKAGFAGTVPGRTGRPLLGRIDLRSGQTGARISAVFIDPQVRQGATAEPPPLAAAPRLRGHIDGYADGRLSGWALDDCAPDRAVFVDIEVEGTRHRDVPAGTFRADLQAAGHGGGRHGFDLILPTALCRAPALHVRIYETGGGDPLFDAMVAGTGPAPFSPTFGPNEYLRWAWLHDTIPSGWFEASATLRAWFAMNRTLLRRPPGSTCLAVDIVMPVHDRSEIVGDAIASVLAQTYDRWRLIVVDDGSTDGTADAVAARIATLGDPRLTLVRLPEHRGVSAARNAGLAQSRGDLVAYLDSDNAWAPDYLEIMAGMMADDADVAAAYCGQEIWEKPSGADAAEFRTIRAVPFNRSYLERVNTIDLNVFMHRRALYKALGGFREDLRRLVDWELILRYTRTQPARFVPAILGRYNLDAAPNRISCIEPIEAAAALIARTHRAGLTGQPA